MPSDAPRPTSFAQLTAPEVAKWRTHGFFIPTPQPTYFRGTSHYAQREHAAPPDVLRSSVHHFKINPPKTLNAGDRVYINYVYDGACA